MWLVAYPKPRPLTTMLYTPCFLESCKWKRAHMHVFCWLLSAPVVKVLVLVLQCTTIVEVWFGFLVCMLELRSWNYCLSMAVAVVLLEVRPWWCDFLNVVGSTVALIPNTCCSSLSVCVGHHHHSWKNSWKLTLSWLDHSILLRLMIRKIRAHLQCNVWEGNVWMTLQQSYQADNTFSTSDVWRFV